MSNISEIMTKYSPDRTNLIPVLKEIHQANGKITPEFVKEVSHYFKISENDVFSVISFYPQLRFAPASKHTIKLCHCINCYLKGSQTIFNTLTEQLKTGPDGISHDGKFRLEVTTLPNSLLPSPVIVIDNKEYDNITPSKLKDILAQY